jgi:N-sulfoglucosamine sulfohydrolase
VIRRNPLLRLVALVLVWCASAHAGETGRPNILVLMAEDMSARVGAFGDAVAITPNIDQLAAEGTRYPNTFTTAGVCAPSRAAHITGMHQIAIGAQHMRTSSAPSGGYKSVPPAHVKAYPELLRAAGYYTFTDRKLDYQFSGPMSGTGPFTIWDAEGGDGHWRARGEGQPFYGLLNFAVTHESGVFRPLGSWPNSVIHLVMQVMRAVSGVGAPDVGESVDPAAVPVPPYFPDTPTVRADIARHYNNIAVMDSEVGQLLDELEADGLTDDTIVIWTTDHGDGLPRSKREVYDTGIKVPMIIRWPERYRPADAARGGLDTRLVSFVDLGPTILRLAGVNVPDYMHGRDLVEAVPRTYIYASRDRIDEVPDRQRAVRDARYKYIRSWHPGLGGGHRLAFRDNIDMVREMQALYAEGELDSVQRRWFEGPGEEQLYDTQTDPLELNNLASDPAVSGELERLRAALASWQARIGDWSDEPEATMVARFNPGGEVPVTTAPEIVVRAGRVQISASDRASVGYRIDQGPWQLYTEPFTAPAGATVEAAAVRYGWVESETVELRIDS